MMTDAAIVMDRLTKSFGGTSVLQNLSLSIPEGQTFALLGRNGAGKTTAIRILLGLLPADSGSVRVAGLDPAREPIAVRKKVGYLAEDQVMYGWMTPTELCQFLSAFYPTWDHAWAKDCLARFDLPPHVKIGRLSKGQTVKLGLAVAMAHRPPIVILDDPALGLDPIARKEFNRDLVEHLQASGSTVLYSSHLLDEVEAVADGVAILDRGTIVRTSPTDELREQVKLILVDRTGLLGIEPPKGLLDIRDDGSRLSLVVDGVAEFVDQLAMRAVNFEVVDLTLDEIFAAFVIGRPHEWPAASAEVIAVAP
jgi:ABC-2 type transport system ATP-binding protein